MKVIIKYFTLPIIMAMIAAHRGNYEAAMIIITIIYAGYVLLHFVHATECKINRLLDDRGIQVSQHAINDEL
jgi:hypothetical protein